MRLQGKVVRWDDDKGFGFIEPRGAGELVFFHVKELGSSLKRPVLLDVVTYEIGSDPKGRTRALEVEYVGESQPTFRVGNQGWVAGTFLLVLALAVVSRAAHAGVLLWYLLTSLVTLLAYADDKSRAKRNAITRTPEMTLHLMSLAGGWPGALIGQGWLRHKSIKQPFQSWFRITLVLNLALLFLLLTVLPKIRP